MVSFSRRAAALVGLAAVPALAWCCFGCASSDSRPAALGDCTGAGCLPGGGQSTPGADAGDSGAAADGEAGPDATATTTLSGNLTLLSDQFFQEPQPLFGSGSLHVPTPSGDQIIPYGVDGGVGYQAQNVLVGPNWFSVFPDDSLADAGISAFPTWSWLDVPPDGSDSFDIPVIDRNVLAVMYAGLENPTAPQADAAQIVLIFESAGQRVSGVSITDHPTSETVAYDFGVGYSSTATQTSVAGVAILVNTQGAGKVTWTATGGVTGSFTLVHVPGQASYARVEVQ